MEKLKFKVKTVEVKPNRDVKLINTKKHKLNKETFITKMNIKRIKKLGKREIKETLESGSFRCEEVYE